MLSLTSICSVGCGSQGQGNIVAILPYGAGRIEILVGPDLIVQGELPELLGDVHQSCHAKVPASAVEIGQHIELRT